MAAKLTREEKYMKAAIREAKKAWALGEVPIGCVIVYEDKVIGRGYNRYPGTEVAYTDKMVPIRPKTLPL